MKTIFYSGIMLILSGLLSSQAAMALAEVKANTIVNKSTITLGDLLDNLEFGHDIWVMNSPPPGQKTSVSTRYLASLTRQHDVYWQNSRGVSQITVTRKGKSIKHAQLEHLIAQALASQNLSDRKNGINFNNKNALIHLPEDSAVEDISVEKFTFHQKTGKFSAVLSVPTDDGAYKSAMVTGRTHAISHVPTLRRQVPPGQEITALDIGWTSMPTLRIGRNIIRTKSQLIGMTPRRGVTLSAPIKLSDLKKPNIIDRGARVSIVFHSGKINLTATGKAIEDGGRGDIIRVMNSKSHKTVEAMVIGPGQVRVLTGHNNIAQLQ